MMRTKLRGGSRRRIDDQVNPMEGALNTVDAFMVCMVGVLAMLIVFYNVDLKQQEVLPVEQKQEMSSVSDVDDESRSIEDDSQYEKMGTVYVDQATGKMYVVSDEEEAATNPE
jgi:hypothetical protein